MTSDTRNAVVILTPWFPNLPGEREGNYIHDSALAVAEAGMRVHVLVARPIRPGTLRPIRQGQATRQNRFPGLEEVRSVAHLSVPRNLTPGMNDAMLDRTVIPALRRLVEDADARLIHVHTESLASAAIRVSRVTGAKVVVTLHGVNVGPRYFGLPSRRSRFRDALSASDRVILVGEPLRPFFKWLAGRDDHFRVVPNGFSLQTVERKSPVLEGERTLHFVSVSNLHEGKGVDVNLQALGLLTGHGVIDWTYTVIGDGAERHRLERLARELGLIERVSFAGARPHDEIARHLSAADVFILPSYREAFGIAYLEAMAAGLLVVGVCGQGPAAFIEHGTSGLLVPPRDVEALARQLEAVIHEPAAFRSIAAGGARVAVEKFNWHGHARSLVGVYREVLEASC